MSRCISLLLAALVGCGDDSGNAVDGALDAPERDASIDAPLADAAEIPCAPLGDAGAGMGSFQWAHVLADRFQQPAGDGVSPLAAAASPGGDVYVVGGFSDTIDIGGHTATSTNIYHDVFVARYGCDGTPLWVRGFGSDLEDIAFAVATDASGDLIVTGGFSDTADFGGTPLASAGDLDMFLLRMSPDGSVRWARRFGTSTYDQGLGVLVRPNGHLVVAGETLGAIDLGGGALAGAGLFLAELDADGNHVWSRGIPTSDMYSGLDFGALALAPNGDVLLAGQLVGDGADFGGGPLSGNYFVTSQDVALGRYDETGRYQWSRRFGGAYNQSPYGLAVEPDESVMLVGRFQTAADFGGGVTLATVSGDYADGFLLHLDAGGASLRAAAVRGPGVTSTAPRLVLLPDGSAVVVGASSEQQGCPPAAADIFAQEWDANLVQRWSRVWGSSNGNAELGLARSPLGSIIIVGNFNGTIDFGGGSLDAPSSPPFGFVLSIAP